MRAGTRSPGWHGEEAADGAVGAIIPGGYRQPPVMLMKRSTWTAPGVEVMLLRPQVRRHQCRAQALVVAGMAAQKFAQVERSSWPRQSTSLPSAVTRTRLQSPQKLLL